MIRANGIPVASLRWLAPWTGVWLAELELDPAATLPPAGPCVITSDEGIALSGTITTVASFGTKLFARVTGGAGGWSKPVRAQHYHSPAGVQLAIVASTTAAAVGEVVTVLEPMNLGADFARRGDAPAAEIFNALDVDWWVGTDGVTRVGTRPPAAPPADLLVTDWDAATGSMTFSASTLPEPGAVLVDARFGTRTVKEVDAEVSGGSVTGTLGTVTAAPDAGAALQLLDDIGEVAMRATRAAFSRLYPYAVSKMVGEQVELEALEPEHGMPDLLPTSIWAGISGYRATLRPESKVLVGFIAANPRRPFLAAYEPPDEDGWRPMELELDALESITIGATAPSITLGGPDATGVATMASLAPLFGQLAAFFTAIQPFLSFPLLADLSGGTSVPAVAPAASAATTLGALATNFSTRVRAS